MLMIPPGAPLEKIVIEGSEENQLEGEFSIDVSEYYVSPDGKPSRVGFKILAGGKKVRIAKRSGEQIPEKN